MTEMRFITDNNIQDSAGDWIGARGYTFHRVRDILLPDTADLVIAAMGDSLEAIVVSYDKDMKSIASRVPDGTRRRFTKLGAIFLTCKAPRAIQRLDATWDYIEFEYARRGQVPEVL